MIAPVVLAILAVGFSLHAEAKDLTYFQTLYGEYSVETGTLAITLDQVDDDVRFSITLRDKETGFERRHELDGQGANDPTPFHLDGGYYCGTSVIFLTIEFPWRHALPLYAPVLETYAFRLQDFALIDAIFGPSTDIALQDDSEEEDMATDMLPPVGVRCLADPATKPFRFFRREPE